MFLAWKELWHNKKKFSLIIALVILITYLVYFLTSLAYGLASLYSDGINKIESSYIVLSTNSNNNAMMSMLDEDDFDDVKLGTNSLKQKLGLFPAVVTNKDGDSDIDSRVEVYVFGVDDINFFIPDNPALANLGDNEVIVDISVKEQGYEIGDRFIMSGNDVEWTIVGFTDKATYQTAPILYTNLKTWKIFRFSGQTNIDFYNAVVVKGSVEIIGEELSLYKTQDYIATLPGYTPQVLTFGMMIGFLIVIIAFVLGIFIYVLTIQKISMFGVMKAQGISNAYISISVISQTVIIVVIGSIIGFVLTLISGYFLGSIVPFAPNFLFYGLITLAFFIFSILGGLFSVREVVRIDPLEAIG